MVEIRKIEDIDVNPRSLVRVNEMGVQETLVGNLLGRDGSPGVISVASRV